MAESPAFDGLESIGDVRAQPPSGEGGGAGTMSEHAQRRFSQEQVLADAKEFCKSGWSFGAEGDPGFGVYKQSGRLFVIGDTLNLKFTPETSPAQIEELLRSHKLQKKRSLGFADNLMTVRRLSPDDEDALALTRRLSDDPRVEFAEPVVLETLGARERRSAKD